MSDPNSKCYAICPTSFASLFLTLHVHTLFYPYAPTLWMICSVNIPLPVIFTFSALLCMFLLLLSTASTITSDGNNVQYTPLRGPVYDANTWTYDGTWDICLIIIIVNTYNFLKITSNTSCNYHVSCIM